MSVSDPVQAVDGKLIGDGQKRIFISCVTSELGHFRDTLRRYLARADCDVKVQEDFHQSDVTTLLKLDAYIRSCSAVVHLVGATAGAVPTPRVVRDFIEATPDFLDGDGELRSNIGNFAELSFSQWEAYLALHHRVPLFVYAATSMTPELGQARHLERLVMAGRYPETFADREDLLGKLIGDLRVIIALPRRTGVPGSFRELKQSLLERLSQLPEFLCAPDRFFKLRFEAGSNVADALIFAAFLSVCSFGVSAALRNGAVRLDVVSVAFATLGNVVLWLLYAMFFLHPSVYIVGGRQGMKYTLSAYLYTIGALQPVFAIVLFAVQLLIPDAAGWDEQRRVMGGSGFIGVVIAGVTLSPDANLVLRGIEGVLALFYFAVGIRRGHELSGVRCGVAIITSLGIFGIGALFLAHWASIELVLRLVRGT